MNNTTFSFNKKQIVQSVLEPDTYSIWLNSKDNKLYKYNEGWEPIGGTNIHRIYLTQYGTSPNKLILDPKYDKENTLARKAFEEDWSIHTNNIYLITVNTPDYGEITGIANCYSQESFLTEITTGIVQDPKTLEYSLYKTIVSIDSELFRDQSISNNNVIFKLDRIKIQATPTR